MRSKKALTRDFAAFERYLIETGLDDDIAEIIRIHHVTLLEIYSSSSKSAYNARLDVMCLLRFTFKKSLNEIGKIFNRGSSTVSKRLKRVSDLMQEKGLLSYEATRAIAESNYASHVAHAKALLAAKSSDK